MAGVPIWMPEYARCRVLWAIRAFDLQSVHSGFFPFECADCMDKNKTINPFIGVY
jgi:hypothetical protein